MEIPVKEFWRPTGSSLRVFLLHLFFDNGGQAMCSHQKWIMRASRSLIVFSIFLGTISPLAAQIGGSGSIQGVVSDPSGAVIPGVTVGPRTWRQALTLRGLRQARAFTSYRP